MFLSRLGPSLERYCLVVSHPSPSSSPSSPLDGGAGSENGGATAAQPPPPQAVQFLATPHGPPLLAERISAHATPYFVERPLQSSLPESGAPSWSPVSVGDVVLALFDDALEGRPSVPSLALSRKRVQRGVEDKQHAAAEGGGGSSEVDPLDHRIVAPTELLSRKWRVCCVARLGAVAQEVWVTPFVTGEWNGGLAQSASDLKRSAVRRGRSAVRSLVPVFPSLDVAEDGGSIDVPATTKRRFLYSGLLASSRSWNDDIMSQVAVNGLQVGGIGFGEGTRAMDLVS